MYQTFIQNVELSANSNINDIFNSLFTSIAILGFVLVLVLLFTSLVFGFLKNI